MSVLCRPIPAQVVYISLNVLHPYTKPWDFVLLIYRPQMGTRTDQGSHSPSPEEEMLIISQQSRLQTQDSKTHQCVVPLPTELGNHGDDVREEENINNIVRTADWPQCEGKERRKPKMGDDRRREEGRMGMNLNKHLSGREWTVPAQEQSQSWSHAFPASQILHGSLPPDSKVPLCGLTPPQADLQNWSSETPLLANCAHSKG